MISLPQIIVSSFLLSLIHVAVPNHWQPLVVIGRAEKWSRFKSLRFAAIAGIALAAGTISGGLLPGWLAYDSYSHHASLPKIIGPILLIILGFLDLFLDARRQNHMPFDVLIIRRNATSNTAFVLSIFEEMYFSLCLEIVVYYFIAGYIGWLGIITVTVVHFTVTTAGLMLIVDWGQRGKEKTPWRILERHSKAVTGVLLLLLGVWAYLKL